MTNPPGRKHPDDDLRHGLERKVIEPSGARRYRARAFQAYVLTAALVFVTLAVSAHVAPYFPIDLRITRAIQGFDGAAFETLMVGVSWFGFGPQVYVLGTLAVVGLFVAGLRWEAVNAGIAAVGLALGTVMKLVVARPRPSADIVKVFAQLSTSSFPSGHVLMATVFGGYLAFLTFTLLRPSWWRTLLLWFLGLMIPLMGLSRIRLGQHWFSDVMGAYLLGSLWLALTIRIYRWGKSRFFVDQPVAKETSRTSGK